VRLVPQAVNADNDGIHYPAVNCMVGENMIIFPNSNRSIIPGE
jgi:hypothetical protein